MAEACKEGLRHRPSDRAFALAEDPWPLAGRTTASTAATRPSTSRRRILPASSAACRHNGFRGGNVTIPHKEAAFALADRRDEAADADRRGQHAVVRGRRPVGRQHRRPWLCRQSRRTRAGLGGTRRGRRARRRRRGAGGHPCAASSAASATSASSTARVARAQELARPFRRRRFGASAWRRPANCSADAGLLVNTTALGMDRQ